jgi:hypothetical protein
MPQERYDVRSGDGALIKSVVVQTGRDSYVAGRMEFGRRVPAVDYTGPVKRIEVERQETVDRLRRERIERNRSRLREAIRLWTISWSLQAAWILPLQQHTDASTMAAATLIAALLGAAVTITFALVRAALKGVLW